MDRDSRPARADQALSSDALLETLRAACAWLVDVAQVRTERVPPEANPKGYPYDRWLGAIRNEYRAATRQWSFFGTVWHTGQAIKALVVAHGLLRDPALLAAAERAAAFLDAQRDRDAAGAPTGLLLAYEDRGTEVNISAILEGLDGLLALSEATGDDRYRSCALAALTWVADHAYLPGQGRFRDHFSPGERTFVAPPWTNADDVAGRPLLDDGVFLKGAQLTGETRWRALFYATADRLLADEEPEGNWIRYAPCNRARSTLHPRQAYWWGRPLLLAYADSGNAAYLHCAERVGDWYRQAQRADGGLFRGTRRDFRTDSFGHATSGVACAVLIWLDLWRATGDERWLDCCHSGLRFCLRMQLRATSDPNLDGTIVEAILPPDGSDRLPYHVRDLAAIFTIQALVAYLNAIEWSPPKKGAAEHATSTR